MQTRIRMVRTIVLALMVGSAAQAATITWNASGSSDADWNTAGNWSPQQVPTRYDLAVVDNPARAVISNGQSGDALDLQAAYDSDASVKVDGWASCVQSVLTVYRTATFGGSPNTNSRSGYLYIDHGAAVTVGGNGYNGRLSLGPTQYSDGQVTIKGVYLSIPSSLTVNDDTAFYVAETGTGRVYQGNPAAPTESPDVAANGGLYIGYNSGAVGTYYLYAGDLSVGHSSDLYVGTSGTGTFQLGTTDCTGTVSVSGDLVVRGASGGTGTFRGYTKAGESVSIEYDFVNNGKVIADGYGTDHDLEFTDSGGAPTIGNTIENATSGTNGWYAQSHGKLVLAVPTSASGFNWGEASADTTIDLVNSIRFSQITGLSGSTAKLGLLALDRSDVPSGPNGYTYRSLWKVESSPSFTFTTASVTVRYDLTYVGTEANLKLAFYRNGTWTVTGSPAGEPNDNTITVAGVAPFTYLAVVE